MKSFLQNNIGIDSVCNEGKSVAAERFIRTLRIKFINTWLQYQKNVYIDKLDHKVDKYNNSYHKTSKMKPFDVNWSMHTDFIKENNKEGPKLKVGAHLRISKYKSIFAKGYVSIWSDKVFMIKKVTNTVSCSHVINNLNGGAIVETFYKKDFQKQIKKSLELKKL